MERELVKSKAGEKKMKMLLVATWILVATVFAGVKLSLSFEENISPSSI